MEMVVFESRCLYFQHWGYKMPTQLKEDWKPDEKYFWENNANKHPMTDHGHARTWVMSQLHEFKMFWCKSMGGNGKPMTSWDLTFWNRCKVLWGNVDKSRYYRQEVDIHQPYDAPVRIREEEQRRAHEKAFSEPLSLEARTAIADKYIKELKI